MAINPKLSTLLNPIDERLPKKTGIGGKLKPFETQNLFNPRLTIRANPAVQAQLAPFRSASPEQVREISAERLGQAVDRINRYIKESNIFKGLRFSVDEPSNRNVAVVRDVKSGEVLREIPPEGVLKLSANLRTLAGILVNREG